MGGRKRFWGLMLGCFALTSAGERPAEACYALVVGKAASTDGSVLVGHIEQNAATRYVIFRREPRASHAPVETVTLQRGATVPQVPETWAYLWSHIPDQEFSDGYLNELGVAVVSDACPSQFGDEEPTDDQIGYWLRRLVAQRARTAREGVEIAGRLVDEYGYAGEGRTYIVADPNEAWAFAAVHGKHWVAQRVPDGEVLVVPNIYVIQEVDLEDTENFLASADLMTFAVEQGWYDPGSGEPFRFRAAYGDPAVSDARQREGQRMLTGSDNPSVADEDLPFSVTPSSPLSVRDVIQHLRAFDTRTTTQEGAVFQLRSWLPVEIGAIYWRTIGSPSYAPLVPWYAGVLRTPEVFFDEPRTAWTALTALSARVADAGGDAPGNAERVWNEVESRLLERCSAIDAHAADLPAGEDGERKEFLTGYSGSAALEVVQLAEKMNADWIASPDLPVALAAAAPASAADSLTYTCDGFALLAAGATTAEYRWDFGDGSTGTGEQTSHRYGEAGHYEIRLTVVDDQGGSSTDTVSVDAVAPPGAPDSGSGCNTTAAGAGVSILLVLVVAVVWLRRKRR